MCELTDTIPNQKRTVGLVAMGNVPQAAAVLYPHHDVAATVFIFQRPSVVYPHPQHILRNSASEEGVQVSESRLCLPKGYPSGDCRGCHDCAAKPGIRAACRGTSYLWPVFV